MTLKTKLPVETGEERLRHSRVETIVKRMLGVFDDVRQLYGWRRFGQLDQALGRKPGFLNLVLTGQERLSLERMLASLDFLEISFDWFFRRVFPKSGLPGPAIGFLTCRKDRLRRRPKINFLGELMAWGTAIKVNADGAEFSQDPESILEVLRVNPAAAYRLSVAALEGLLALKPDRLTLQAAENLCRVLVPLADTLRVRGDRNSACDLLDLAFQIENQLEIAELRAFIFRISSYLLSDLGYLPDAEEFADHSLELTTSCADLDGIGRSWYLRGVMADRQRMLDAAITCYHSCLLYQEWLTSDVWLAAQLELAMVHLEREDVLTAKCLIEAIQPEIPEDGVFRARFLWANAELAALENRSREAQALFEQTEEIYAALSFLPDAVIVRLQHIKFLLREGRVLESSELARQLIPLASQLRGNQATEAILLGLARGAYQDRLVLASVSNAIQHCKRPWFAERFTYPTGSI